MWLNGQCSHPSLAFACCTKRREVVTVSSFPVPNFNSSSAQITNGGRGGKGAGTSLLEQYCHETDLLASPARYLNLTLLLWVLWEPSSLLP